jgi:hypothetical protein
MPYFTYFPGQEPNEKVIMVLRRHPWLLFKILFLYFVLLIIPLLLNGIFQKMPISQQEEPIFLAGILASVYYLYVLTFFFRAWVDHYLDLWVVTDKRIVNIEQKGLFSRTISTVKLYRIQDVTSEVKGFLPTFFHYGNVLIQSAGHEGHFIFKQIPNPYSVSRKITALVKWRQQRTN